MQDAIFQNVHLTGPRRGHQEIEGENSAVYINTLKMKEVSDEEAREIAGWSTDHCGCLRNNHSWVLPGGPVVKNPPANAGDTGSSPGPGRSHMPRSNWAREPQLLKPTRSRARVPQLVSPRAATTEACVPRAHSLQQEKPLQ